MAFKIQSKLKFASKDIAENEPKFTDLRQVMDYKRPLSIFYSGVEYEEYLDILYNLGIRNFLMSYEYLKGKGHSQIKKYSDISLFIDSGAFTYMVDPKYENYTIEMWEDHIEKYLEWVKKHRDSIFAIADLDLQLLSAVGNDKVYEWRKKYFEPFMLETGVPVCMIYHFEGLDVWERMCQRYPYVGMSLNVDSKEINESTLRDMFRIAERHNALVQGMASTNTSLLTTYPFYSVDATTWNVGLKYGEISVWNDTKMSRMKKENFETKAFPIISRYDIPFDFDLIRSEDKTEMVRVNAYAFVLAEKYIHERLKASMYWLKAKTVKIDLDDLPSDFYPSMKWFYSDMENIKDYAVKLNINPEYDKLQEILYECVAFMNWDVPQYKDMRNKYEYDSTLLTQIHDKWVNRIVPDDETRIEDLQNFFAECVSGKNDKLLQLGTNFDRITKERDRYIEEEEEFVDVDESVIREKLKEVIPTENDAETEITGLDDEIFKKVDIIPVRDEKGKFLKGQTAVYTPKKVYSKKFPKMTCSFCPAAQKCAEYKDGYVCAYNKLFGKFETRDLGDVILAMQGIVDQNIVRMQKAMLMETINGTQDAGVSFMMNQNMAFLKDMAKLYEASGNDFLRYTRVTKPDGSFEESAVLKNPQSGSILEKLFSADLKSKDGKEEIEEVIEVQAEKTVSPLYQNLEDDLTPASENDKI